MMRHPESGLRIKFIQTLTEQLSGHCQGPSELLIINPALRTEKGHVYNDLFTDDNNRPSAIESPLGLASSGLEPSRIWYPSWTLSGRLGRLTGRTWGQTSRAGSRLGVFPEVEALQPLNSVDVHRADDRQIMTSV